MSAFQWFVSALAWLFEYAFFVGGVAVLLLALSWVNTSTWPDAGRGWRN